MAEEFRNKLVIVVRTDIKLSPGKLAVQVAHASVSCAVEAKRSKERWFKDWYSEGQKKVVLKARNLDELKDLMVLARSVGLTSVLVQDAGLTEVEPGTVTCLGIGPGPNPEVDKVTGSLPLL